MSDLSVSIRGRLMECFATVFPDLPPAEIPEASAGSVKQWDSIAHITLLTSIAEELGLELDTEDFGTLTSFAAIEEFASRKLAGRA
jgi:acyl carrier protein